MIYIWASFEHRFEHGIETCRACWDWCKYCAECRWAYLSLVRKKLKLKPKASQVVVKIATYAKEPIWASAHCLSARTGLARCATSAGSNRTGRSASNKNIETAALGFPFVIFHILASPWIIEVEKISTTVLCRNEGGQHQATLGNRLIQSVT